MGCRFRTRSPLNRAGRRCCTGWKSCTNSTRCWDTAGATPLTAASASNIQPVVVVSQGDAVSNGKQRLLGVEKSENEAYSARCPARRRRPVSLLRRHAIIYFSVYAARERVVDNHSRWPLLCYFDRILGSRKTGPRQTGRFHQSQQRHDNV